MPALLGGGPSKDVGLLLWQRPLFARVLITRAAHANPRGEQEVWGASSLPPLAMNSLPLPSRDSSPQQMEKAA